MQIINSTKQTVLSRDATFIKTEKERVKGLIGEKNPKTILFETRFGIHTFFMKFAIDVLILDEDNTIVALKEHLKPNRIFMWNPKYKTVIELPSGTIKNSKTKLGDQSEIEEVPSPLRACPELDSGRRSGHRLPSGDEVYTIQ